MPDAAEIAWAAGLFEGEGCIRDVGVHSVELIVHMGDRDVLERFAQVVGVGKVMPVRRLNPDHAHWSPMFYWKITAAPHVRRILTAFLPWLLERRSTRAGEALARLKHNQGSNRDKTHCVRGHELFGGNLLVVRNGGRRCRTCDNARKRAWWHKKKGVKTNAG